MSYSTVHTALCLKTMRPWKVTRAHEYGGAFVSRLQGDCVSDAKVLPAIINVMNLLVVSFHRPGRREVETTLGSVSVAVLRRLDSLSSFYRILPGK